MYWCNCLEVYKAREIKLTKLQRFYEAYRPYVQVKAPNGYCEHCEHAAFYSKNNPNEGEGGTPCLAL